METVQQQTATLSPFATRIPENSVRDGERLNRIGWRLPGRIWITLVLLLATFLTIGPVLQRIDPAAGILDIGILSVLLLGIIVGLVAVFFCLWLQELLWQPFQAFRKQFHAHFNQLTSWQQCIIYFSVFFLLLYALLWGLAMLL